MNQIKLEEIVGKTVKAIEDNGSDTYLLVFTDGSFCHFEATGGEFPFLRNLEVDLAKPYTVRQVEWFIEHELIRQEDYDRAEAAYMLEHKRKERENKLYQFNRLKEELGL